MHCPLSHCVFVPFIHAAKSFVVPPDVQREVEEVFPLQSEQSLCQYFLSQSYDYYIHIIPELCSEFHVINVGLIMPSFSETIPVDISSSSRR